MPSASRRHGSRGNGTGTKATGATVSTKALVSVEEVASEGTGEDGGAEAAFKESGSIKLETMSCEDETGKSKSSEWKFGGDSAHGRVTIPDQYAPPIFTGNRLRTRKSGSRISDGSRRVKGGPRSRLVSFSHSA
jgi:hypothetical protein